MRRGSRCRRRERQLHERDGALLLGSAQPDCGHPSRSQKLQKISSQFLKMLLVHSITPNKAAAWLLDSSLESVDVGSA
jgi:hypothetical protein